MYNSRTLTLEEAIHVRFNDNKPNTTMSKLDESFAEMKIEDIVKSIVASSQNQLVSMDDAISNEYWAKEMQKKLDQFRRMMSRSL